MCLNICKRVFIAGYLEDKRTWNQGAADAAGTGGRARGGEE